jgi:hypothetical protein
MELKVGTWCKSYSKGTWRVSRIERGILDYDWEGHDWSHNKSDVIFLRRIVGPTLKKSFAVETCDSCFVTPLASDDLLQLEELLKLKPKLLAEFDQFCAPDPDSVLNVASSLPAVRVKVMASLFPTGQLYDCKTILTLLRSSPVGDSLVTNPKRSTIQFVSPQTQIKKGKIQYEFSRILEF